MLSPAIVGWPIRRFWDLPHHLRKLGVQTTRLFPTGYCPYLPLDSVQYYPTKSSYSIPFAISVNLSRDGYKGTWQLAPEVVGHIYHIHVHVLTLGSRKALCFDEGSMLQLQLKFRTSLYKRGLLHANVDSYQYKCILEGFLLGERGNSEGLRDLLTASRPA
jgi:hypothetical protein